MRERTLPLHQLHNIVGNFYHHTHNDTLQAPIDIDILLTMSLSITIIFRCLNELQQKSLRVGILSPHSHAHYPRCTRYILFSFVCCDFIMRKMGDPLCVT